MRELFKYLSTLGSKMNLNFSSCEFLKDVLIGFDTEKRKLLVVRGLYQDNRNEILIDLDEVKSCSLKKVYGPIKAGDLKRRRLDQLLEEISLHFEFRGDKAALEVPFYEYSENETSNRIELANKARNWVLKLSDMLRYRKEVA